MIFVMNILMMNMTLVFDNFNNDYHKNYNHLYNNI